MTGQLHFCCILAAAGSWSTCMNPRCLFLQQMLEELWRGRALLADAVIPAHLCVSWTSSLCVLLHNPLEALADASHETPLLLRYHSTLQDTEWGRIKLMYPVLWYCSRLKCLFYSECRWSLQLWDKCVCLEHLFTKMLQLFLSGISGYGGRWREHKRGLMGKCLQHAASGE